MFCIFAGLPRSGNTQLETASATACCMADLPEVPGFAIAVSLEVAENQERLPEGKSSTLMSPLIVSHRLLALPKGNY